MTSKILAIPPAFTFSDSDDENSKIYNSELNFQVNESIGSIEESIRSDGDESESENGSKITNSSYSDDSSLSEDYQSLDIKVSKKVPESFLPDQEELLNLSVNIYQNINQADVNYMSTKYILSSIISCKCSKKNLMGFGCLELVSSLEDLQQGRLTDSISLISKIRGDILTMSEMEKHNYIAKLLGDTEIKGTSRRLMVKYRLFHPDLKNGKYY